MTDTFDAETRSRIMRAVRSEDTGPEMKVRSLTHRLGFRFRLHRKDLPGKPDLVFPSLRKVMFVHGCFWHRHRSCREATMPASRREYWVEKLTRNAERDRKNLAALRKLGWKALVVWECEIRNLEHVERKISHFLES